MFLLSADYWQVKKIKGKGRGVFAKKEINPGTVIGDYLGTVISEQREGQENEKSFYAMHCTDKLIVLPDPKQIGIHLINHACAPNCAMHSYRGHVIYFALRRIFPGEELTVNYLYDVLLCRAGECREHICRCGALNCRGNLHTPTQLIKMWEKYEAPYYRPFRNYCPARYGQNLLALDTYPRRIADIRGNELYGSSQKPPYVSLAVRLPAVSKVRALIRETGRRIYFKKIDFTVNGVSGALIIGSR
ncbi:MAG: SET domain-containing protein [Candidatus Buchananbacteria bacterium]|nr:SET domain-containing protein [Candidatus Buchananbacteria bacterium]